MLFDYQLDRHCSKNAGAGPTSCRQFDYQLDRHCSKTFAELDAATELFDYQLDRHCSKTQERRLHGRTGLITS